MMKIEANIVDIIKKKVFFGSIQIESGKIYSIKEKTGKSDKYILPGFIDSHIHIESTMLVPSEFSPVALSFGTTAVVADPHEIANILGIKGVRYMIENAEKVPLRFYFGAPSCVPATEFETSGAVITPDDIETLMENDEVSHLSEVMNYPAVLAEVPDIMTKMEIAKKFGKEIDGHAPHLSGVDLEKYISAGCRTDHEADSFAEGEEKIQKGMKILIREGSAAKNFDALADLIDKYPESVMFCSDDIHADDLVKGHINLLVKRAIAKGYDLFNVLRAASLNPKKHYYLNTGLLEKGDNADFIIVDSLTDFNVLETYIAGEKVFDRAEPITKKNPVRLVNKFDTIPKVVEDFNVIAKGDMVKVIVAENGELITKKIIAKAKIENGFALSDVENDILKIVNLSRYNTTKPSIAFIKNFGLHSGAIASSIAHDSHNIIAVGADDDSLLKAVNSIIRAKGGICVCSDGEIDQLDLPVAGLMSDLSAEKVASKYTELNKKVKDLGCKLDAPFMTLSFMGLLVIPELKLSDKGLFDSTTFQFIELFEE
ncbi:MAG: adenine deaminase [bacterium]